MDWVSNHLAEALVVAGLLLLTIEVAILGFATFVLFFVGIAAIFAGALMYLGVIPETTMAAVLAVGIISAVDAVLLWKPLKRFQQQVDKKQASNDLEGHVFTLANTVSATEHPQYHYSGINWTLKSEQQLEAGTAVKVVRTEVGIFHIEPA